MSLREMGKKRKNKSKPYTYKEIIKRHGLPQNENQISNHVSFSLVCDTYPRLVDLPVSKTIMKFGLASIKRYLALEGLDPIVLAFWKGEELTTEQNGGGGGEGGGGSSSDSDSDDGADRSSAIPTP